MGYCLSSEPLAYIHSVKERTRCSVVGGPAICKGLSRGFFAEVFQEKEGKPTVVITVEMAQEDGIELARIESRPLRREQGRGTAIEQEKALGCFRSNWRCGFFLGHEGVTTA